MPYNFIENDNIKIDFTNDLLYHDLVSHYANNDITPYKNNNINPIIININEIDESNPYYTKIFDVYISNSQLLLFFILVIVIIFIIMSVFKI